MKFLAITISLLLSFSAFIYAQQKPERVDEFGKATIGEMKARIDIFATRLKNDEKVDAVIVIYPGRKNGAPFSLYQSWKKRINDYLVLRLPGINVDINRFTFIEGGIVDEIKTELWFVPRGAEYPRIEPRSPKSPPDRAKSFVKEKEFITDISQTDQLQWMDQIFEQFAASLLAHPNTYAAILSRPGKDSTARSLKIRQVRIKNYLIRKGIDPSRVSFIDGSKREEMSIQLWLVRKGVNFPPKKPQLPNSAALFDTFEVRPDNVLTWKNEYEAKREKYADVLYAANLKPYLVTYEPRILRPDKYSMAKPETRLPRHFDFVLNANFWRWGLENGWVKSIDGGNREYSAVEFWIVPPGAEPPKPTPTVPVDEAISCPMVAVSRDYMRTMGKELLVFKASHEAKGQVVKYGFDWTVENGVIESGQGTDTIKVRAKEGFLGNVKAQVRMTGFDNYCEAGDSRAEGATEIWKDRYKLDEFGKATSGDMKARLDWYNNLIHSGSDVLGVFIIYPEIVIPATSKKRASDLRKFIAFRGFDESKFMFLEGGPRDELATEFWLVQKGRELPVPVPMAANPNQAKCPKINIIGPFLTPTPAGELEYRATYNGQAFPNDPGFKWSVTYGEILSGSDEKGSFGQGTNRIRLKLKGDFRSTVNIGLEMRGSAAGCERLTASVSTMTGEERYEVSRYNQTFAELREDVKRFVDYLERDPSLIGYVINYGSPVQIRRREQMMLKLFPRSIFAEYGGPRITFINGGYDKDSKDLTTELWVSRPGVPVPPMHSEKE